MDNKRTSGGLAAFLERRSWIIILGFVAVTLSLIVPMLALGVEGNASSEPGGSVFDLRDWVEDQFASPVFSQPYIVEAHNGDMLTRDALGKLYQREQALREADQLGQLHPEGLPVQPYLYQGFDAGSNRPILGINTIADAVQGILVNHPGFGKTLAEATDDEVKLAIHFLLQDPAFAGLQESFSVKSTSQRRVVAGEEIDYWTVPALTFPVLADNEKLGGGSSFRVLGGDQTVLDKEEFSRNVQRILRGDPGSYQLWGVAIDLNLESDDEGRTAGMFITFTVIAAVLVAGASLRSYWAMALTGVGLGLLIIWLQGISNLVGIKGGLVIELIVPIAMVSLGVDFAIHAISRYQEEKRAGHPPRLALRVGFAGVLGALALAMVSDNIAFLSNASSRIESVIHFGIAATIAVTSAFLVLGVFLPLVMMRLDLLQGPRLAVPSWPARLMVITSSLGVAALSGSSVILMVAVNALVGLAMLLGATVGFLVVPALFFLWRNSRRSAPVEPAPQPPEDVRGDWLASVVVALARHPLAVILVTTVITTGATLLALKLEPSFDVKDFFDRKSDFVVGLDKLSEHVSTRGGETAIIYVEGNLADPEALAAIQRFLSNLADNPFVAKDFQGQPSVEEPNILSVLRRVIDSEYAQSTAQAVTEVVVQDSNGDGLPDSREQIDSIYQFALLEGVPLNQDVSVYIPSEVRMALLPRSESGRDDAAVLRISIPNSRQQTIIKEARQALQNDLEMLRDSPGITSVGLTGSPFTREAQLAATTRTLQTSLPLAAAAILVVLLLVTRSLSYAVVTIIPVGLVVAWLYALMYLAGFALNFVTATIGAVSIGVGVDYSIHVTARFREELGHTREKELALRQAMRGTGKALLFSAASSVVGFSIMGLSPMPMFSSYGFLTAIMITLAMLASLVILPSLLLKLAARG